jgi:hypothetical protein
MLRWINSDPLWLGNINYINTSAIGGSLGNRKIIQPKDNVVANRWYRITVGREVGIFTLWHSLPVCL